MENKRLMITLFSVLIVLLIPLIAMQFTNEVDWDTADSVSFLCKVAIHRLHLL